MTCRSVSRILHGRQLFTFKLLTMLYKKAILKLSGEAISGPDSFGFDFKRIKLIADEIKIFQKKKIKLGIVIGGGNLFRARMIKNNEISRVGADYMGMLSTNLNALCLKNVFQNRKIKTKILSELSVDKLIEKFNIKKAQQYWRQGYVLIFSGGTGKPYFTTDTGALLKAEQMKADIVFKATQVNGVYDKDPEKYQGAKMFKELSYQEAIDKKLKIMDQSAFKIAQKNKIFIRVFKFQKNNLKKIIQGADLGTVIR